MTGLLAWLATLPSATRKVLGIVVLLLVLGLLVWLYGLTREHRGAQLAVVHQREVRAHAMLDTAKHEYQEEVQHVRALKQARREAPRIKVLKPGVVELHGTPTVIPLEVTMQLDTDRVRLARDTLIMDTLLTGWHHALAAADSSRAVADVYKSRGSPRLAIKIAGVTVVVAGLVLLASHLGH